MQQSSSLKSQQYICTNEIPIFSNRYVNTNLQRHPIFLRSQEQEIYLYIRFLKAI